jgi:hypothetical protein
MNIFSRYGFPQDITTTTTKKAHIVLNYLFARKFALPNALARERDICLI